MNVPGAAGIRVHDITLAEWKVGCVAPIGKRLDLLETLVAAKPYSVELWAGAVEEIKRTRWAPDDVHNVNVAARVHKPEECNHELHRVAAQVVFAGVRCDKSTLKDDLQRAKAVVKEASDVGLQVRAYVLNAFDGEDEDDNMNHAMATDAILNLADYGANLIVISDCKAKAHEDSLRELLEEAFYMDVAGDTMLERLGLRASLQSCRIAAKLGVQHFDACLRAPAFAHLQGPIADTRELIEMLEAEGKECSVDSKGLHAFYSAMSKP